MSQIVSDPLPDFASQGRLLKAKQIRALLGGISRTTLWRLMSRKTDPLPAVRLTPKGPPMFPLDKVLWWRDKHEIMQ